MDVKNNQIYFNVKENKVTVKSRGPVTFEDMSQILFTGLLGAMRQLVDTAPDEHKEQVKGHVYDMVNQAASRTLEMFAPEYELHPDLTAKAMLDAENAYIEKEYKKLKEKKTKERFKE